MAKRLFANRPASTIATTGGINSSATTFAPASISGFPDATAGEFTIGIDSELMLVTGYSSPNWTVTRGVEGTTAASHAEGANIFHPLTADGLDSLFAIMHSGTITGKRRSINFVDTGNVAFTITDDSTNKKVDVAGTVASVSGAVAHGTWTVTTTGGNTSKDTLIDLTSFGITAAQNGLIAVVNIQQDAFGTPNQGSGATWAIADVGFKDGGGAGTGDTIPPTGLYIRAWLATGSSVSVNLKARWAVLKSA